MAVLVFITILSLISVIPAKAGIYCLNKKYLISFIRNYFLKHWIPAFAGMTKNALQKIKILSVLLCLISAQTSHATNYKDTDIKAALLYKILFFVDFKTSQTSENLNICVLDDEVFLPFQKNLESREVEGKKIKIIKTSEEKIKTGNCNILFLSQNYKANFKKIIAPYQSQPLLVVSDIQQFAKNGGMIGLTNFNSTIQIEINLKALEKANFKIDPNLLEVALHVY